MRTPDSLSGCVSASNNAPPETIEFVFGFNFTIASVYGAGPPVDNLRYLP
jgi:hypothetical protein